MSGMPWRQKGSAGSTADLNIVSPTAPTGTKARDRGMQRSDRRHHRTSTEAAARISNGTSTYQIGQEIGRGGFGTVFQALNTDTGDFVAVKRVALHNIDNDSLAAIRQEIDLLKKLNHVHIVQYIDTIQTDSFLHIVLEIMESSLSAMCKKFGNFSESLTAIYMTQVLEGLKYLHEQGVLHRDIKGANILTTKNGLVKLADFGVALRLGDAAGGAAAGEDVDVVGTPYWMAPEIVEMTGVTTACDVWSVGCTVIELLMGKPPYFDLPQMAALYKIVQDDHPPLPDGISAALRDFLLQCFKKEPQMRAGAANLLSHVWLRNPRGHLQRVGNDEVAKQHAVTAVTAAATAGGGGGAAAAAAAAGAAAAERQAMLKTVKTYAQLMQEQSPQRRYDLSASDVADLNQIAERICEDADEAVAAAAAAAAGAAAPRPPAGSSRTPPPRRVPDDGEGATARNSGGMRLSPPSAGYKPQAAAAARVLDGDGDDSEDWDRDFGGAQAAAPAAPSAVNGVAAAGSRETFALASAAGAAAGAAAMPSRLSLTNIGPGSEEAKQQLRAMRGSGGSAAAATTGGKSRQGSLSGGPKSTPTLDADALDDWGDDDMTPHALTASGGALSHERHLVSDAGTTGVGSNSLEAAGLSRFVEADETFEDIELPQEGGGGGGLSFFKLSAPAPTALADKLKQKMARQQARTGAAAPADPFGKELEAEESEFEGRSGRLERDSHARVGSEVFAELSRMQAATDNAVSPEAYSVVTFAGSSSGNLIGDGGGSGSGGGRGGGSGASSDGGSSSGSTAGGGLDELVLEGCGRVRAMLEACPEARFYVLSAEHGVGPVLQLAEAAGRGLGPAAAAQVVAVVNRIVDGNPKALEHLALVGIIPRILIFAAPAPAAALPPAAPAPPPARSGALAGSRAAAAVSAPTATPAVFPAVTPLRAEAARFVRALCHTSDFALQLFVSCGGLATLVDFLGPPAVSPAVSAVTVEQDSAGSGGAGGWGVVDIEGFDTSPEARRLVRTGLDGLLQVFSLQRIRRNDCCRLLLRLGLLPNVMDVFSGLLRAVLAAEGGGGSISNSCSCDAGDLDGAGGTEMTRPTPRSLGGDGHWPYLEKAAAVLLTFSKSDKALKESMAHSDKCLQGIVQALRDLSPPAMLRRPRAAKLAVTLLQVVKNVSMEPATLAGLEAAGAVQTLVPLLERTGGPCDKDMENQVLQCMFYLCRISRKRQERAAVAGVVPFLQRCIAEESYLKQFALQIVCDLPHAGGATREILWANGGVNFYLGIMVNPADRHWHVTALRSVSAWLLVDPERVEKALIEPAPLRTVLGLFRSAEGAEFEKVVEELHLMMAKSPALVAALGDAPEFIEEIKQRLHYPKAIVAKTLLAMLRSVYRAHPAPQRLLRDFDLYPSVSKLARNNAQVLVAEIATQLLTDFDEQGKFGT